MIKPVIQTLGLYMSKSKVLHNVKAVTHLKTLGSLMTVPGTMILDSPVAASTITRLSSTSLTSSNYIVINICSSHRLTMELDLPSKFWLHVT